MSVTNLTDYISLVLPDVSETPEAFAPEPCVCYTLGRAMVLNRKAEQ